ncbi:MAG: hypothetical protein HC888_07275 [Candidatus Competibacteraceae bacterium]|nr:hypothetical protein [Candidatus Competibacteraceae bacterium]
MQEARALKGLYEAGVARESVATGSASLRMGASPLQLAGAPPDIQEEAGAGMFNQSQIKQLYSLRHDREQLYDAVKRLKTAKQRGEKAPKRVSKRQAVTINTKKNRDVDEIRDMMELLAKNVGYGLHTRSLAWVNGDITTAELFDDIRTLDSKGAFALIEQYRAGDLDPDQLAEALDDCLEFRKRTLHLPETF